MDLINDVIDQMHGRPPFLHDLKCAYFDLSDWDWADIATSAETDRARRVALAAKELLDAVNGAGGI